MIMDRIILKDLDKWKELLNLTSIEIRKIKKDLKNMKTNEFKNLIDMVTRKPDGTKEELWFNLDNFTPVTLAIYHLKIKSLRFIMENIWQGKYTDRVRTTNIIAALPLQKVKYSKKYNFVHSDKQGKPSPKVHYYEKKKLSQGKLF